MINKNPLVLYFLIFFWIQGIMSQSEQVAKGNVQFSNQLFHKLLEKSQSDENVFFSPISIHTVLSLIYQGAKNETQQALSTVLNVPAAAATAEGYKDIMSQLNNVENVTLNIANKIWVNDNYRLKESFKSLASEKFYAEAEQANFAKSDVAASNINNWVEKKTNNKIKDLISQDMIDSMTAMVLVNAVYFKGDWAKKFNKELTRKKPFYITNENVINVDMMMKEDSFRFGVNDELDAKILELPYANPDVSMLIVLPNKRDGIKQLEEKIVTKDLNELSRNLRKMKVEVQIPKFKIETKINLKEILTDMGLGVIFSELANFKDLLDSDAALSVSEAIQKAFVEVNEEGTEAAAATAAIMMLRSMPMPQEIIQFVADHPFVFYLLKRDAQSITLLFEGRITKPLSS